jgi:hypothetical protein
MPLIDHIDIAVITVKLVCPLNEILSIFYGWILDWNPQKIVSQLLVLLVREKVEEFTVLGAIFDGRDPLLVIHIYFCTFNKVDVHAVVSCRN